MASIAAIFKALGSWASENPFPTFVLTLFVLYSTGFFNNLWRKQLERFLRELQQNDSWRDARVSQYGKMTEGLMDVHKSLVSLRKAIQNYTSVIEESHMGSKEQRGEAVNEKMGEFVDSWDENCYYLPTEVSVQIDSLIMRLRKIVREFQYRVHRPQQDEERGLRTPEVDVKYWMEAFNQLGEMRAESDAILNVIREIVGINEIYEIAEERRNEKRMRERNWLQRILRIRPANQADRPS